MIDIDSSCDRLCNIISTSLYSMESMKGTDDLPRFTSIAKEWKKSKSSHDQNNNQCSNQSTNQYKLYCVMIVLCLM